MAGESKRGRAKKPSMYDVARLAGVSQTAVSFVVNDVPDANIPQETKDRIWAAIKELGWRPKLTAKTAIEWTIDWYKQPAENLIYFTFQQIKDYFAL